MNAARISLSASRGPGQAADEEDGAPVTLETAWARTISVYWWRCFKGIRCQKKRADPGLELYIAAAE